MTPTAPPALPGPLQPDRFRTVRLRRHAKRLAELEATLLRAALDLPEPKEPRR